MKTKEHIADIAVNTSLNRRGHRGNDREPKSADGRPIVRPRFNWRGNRPRMGKRSMCPLCGAIYHAGSGGLCIECGEREVIDVSYED